MPFLDQIVERFLPRIELNIEIKGNNPALAAAMINILKGSRYRDKVIVSSFCLDPLIYVRDHASDLRRACLVGDDEIKCHIFRTWHL